MVEVLDEVLCFCSVTESAGAEQDLIRLTVTPQSEFISWTSPVSCQLSVTSPNWFITLELDVQSKTIGCCCSVWTAKQPVKSCFYPIRKLNIIGYLFNMIHMEMPHMSFLRYYKCIQHLNRIYSQVYVKVVKNGHNWIFQQTSQTNQNCCRDGWVWTLLNFNKLKTFSQFSQDDCSNIQPGLCQRQQKRSDMFPPKCYWCTCLY